MALNPTAGEIPERDGTFEGTGRRRPPAEAAAAPVAGWPSCPTPARRRATGWPGPFSWPSSGCGSGPG